MPSNSAVRQFAVAKRRFASKNCHAAHCRTWQLVSPTPDTRAQSRPGAYLAVFLVVLVKDAAAYAADQAVATAHGSARRGRRADDNRTARASAASVINARCTDNRMGVFGTLRHRDNKCTDRNGRYKQHSHWKSLPGCQPLR